MTRIYTRTGDDGTTGLFGGPRVPKSHARIEAYGAVDETNAHLGRARMNLQEYEIPDSLLQLIKELQEELFVLGADLATPVDAKAPTARIQPEHVERLEEAIDRYDEELPDLDRFVLPGGTAPGADFHVARTVCRRAERTLVHARSEAETSDDALRYLNRLSDLLFVLGRWVNHRLGAEEEKWRADLDG
jgi:cob(I)alamin adenosyltransferase